MEEELCSVVLAEGESSIFEMYFVIASCVDVGLNIERAAMCIGVRMVGMIVNACLFVQDPCNDSWNALPVEVFMY